MPTQRPPEDPGRPTPREAIARATAAAAPKVAKAVEAAGPKVEKAALSAGKLLGTLRERARDTAKQFNEAYGGSAAEDKPDAAGTPEDPPGRPRPRPTRN